MRTQMMIGLVAGSIIGAGATMIALPYLEPQFGKKMKKGKRMLRKKLQKVL